MKKLLIILLIFVLAFSLGCIGENKNVNYGSLYNVSGVLAEENKLEEEEPKVPVYEAPLDPRKIHLSCENDSDCVIIKYKTGIGESEYCININSSYKGVHSDKCYCKRVSEYYSFYNGTESMGPIKECHHI